MKLLPGVKYKISVVVEKVDTGDKSEFHNFIRSHLDSDRLAKEMLQDLMRRYENEQ